VQSDLQQLTTEIPIASDRLGGQVRWYNDEKGYGFIVPDDDGDDVFVRYSAISGDGFRCLAAGQRVTFERSDDGRGPRALHVQPA